MSNKEEKKIPEKKFFDIKLETLVPCTITYRIFAEDESIAILNIDKQSPRSVKPDISKKRKIKATVYAAGSNTIKLTKTYQK